MYFHVVAVGCSASVSVVCWEVEWCHDGAESAASDRETSHAVSAQVCSRHLSHAAVSLQAHHSPHTVLVTVSLQAHRSPHTVLVTQSHHSSHTLLVTASHSQTLTFFIAGFSNCPCISHIFCVVTVSYNKKINSFNSLQSQLTGELAPNLRFIFSSQYPHVATGRPVWGCLEIACK